MIRRLLAMLARARGHLSIALGWNEAAARAYRRLAELSRNDPAVLAQTALVQRQLGDEDGRRATELWLFGLKPGNAQLGERLAREAVGRGDYEKALGLLETVIGLKPADCALRVALGEVLIKLGRLAEARKCLSEVLTKVRDRNVIRWLYKVAQILSIRRALDEALLAYEAITVADPADVTARLAVVRTLIAMGDLEGASAAHARLLSRAGEPGQPLAQRLEHLRTLRECARGELLLAGEATPLPSRVNIETSEGAISVLLPAVGGPVETLAAPADPAALRESLAERYMAAGRHDRALFHLGLLPPASPAAAASRRAAHRGLALLRMGKTSAARQELAAIEPAALAADTPEQREECYALGHALLHVAEPRRAAAVFKRILLKDITFKDTQAIVHRLNRPAGALDPGATRVLSPPEAGEDATDVAPESGDDGSESGDRDAGLAATRPPAGAPDGRGAVEGRPGRAGDVSRAAADDLAGRPKEGDAPGGALDRAAGADRPASPGRHALATRRLSGPALPPEAAAVLEAGRRRGGRPALQVGKYTLEGVLATGFLGDLYLGADADLGRPVVLRRLSQAITSDRATRTRFLEQARSATRFSGEHLAAVLDVVEPPDEVWIVSERATGCSLGAELLAGRRYSMIQATSIVAQAARGLAGAHAAGMIHGDLKASDVVCRPIESPAQSDQALPLERPPGGYRAKVVDLGLSMVSNVLDVAPADYLKRRAPFMSPEFIGGERCDARSDVFALGVLLYRLLAGQFPFQDADVYAVMYRIMESSAPAPSARGTPLPAPLEALVMRCLARDRENRPTDAATLASQLGAMLGEAAP